MSQIICTQVLWGRLLGTFQVSSHLLTCLPFKKCSKSIIGVDNVSSAFSPLINMNQDGKGRIVYFFSPSIEYARCQETIIHGNISPLSSNLSSTSQYPTGISPLNNRIGYFIQNQPRRCFPTHQFYGPWGWLWNRRSLPFASAWPYTKCCNPAWEVGQSWKLRIIMTNLAPEVDVRLAIKCLDKPSEYGS